MDQDRPTYLADTRPSKTNFLNVDHYQETLIQNKSESYETFGHRKNQISEVVNRVQPSNQIHTTGVDLRDDTQSRATSSGISYPHSFNSSQQLTRFDSWKTNRKEPSYSFFELEGELADKEAKLKKELAYLNQYHNQWARPRQIREPRREPVSKVVASSNEQRWIKECPNDSNSRPVSRASSTRSNTEVDLLDKTEKLKKDAEELVKKPLARQQIIIENGCRKEHPSFELDYRQGIKSEHIAVIREPPNEVDNKSPLPFSFDNLSTLGVRGNIASVGASEPETPFPPIFPTIRRTPSPLLRKV